MFCDHCDRGYHTFCVGLKEIPAGRWECPSCAPAVTAPPKPKSVLHIVSSYHCSSFIFKLLSIYIDERPLIWKI